MGGAPAAPGDQPRDGAAQDPTKSPKRKTENPNDDEQSIKSYECRFCHKFFNKHQALGGHMNTHSSERKKEALESAQALLSRHLQLPGSHNLNASFGGGLAQNPFASLWMNHPEPERGVWPLNMQPADYYPQTGLARSNMSFPSLLNLNSMMQSNTSIHLQQIPSNLHWNEDNSNVPRAAGALENEPKPNSSQNHDLEDEVTSENNQPPHEIVPNPY